MAVEMILSIEDKEKREKMNKFARQALDRAEELKGIRKSTNQSPDQDPVKTIPVQNTASSTAAATAATSPSSNAPNRSITVATHSPKLEITRDRGGYSMEEKKVLEKTSLINSRIYVPFMETDAKEKFNFPIPFTDKDGKQLITIEHS